MTTEMELANVRGLMTNGVGIWLGDIEKDHEENVKTVSATNPNADFVVDFDSMKWDIGFDFILARNFIRTTQNPLRTIGNCLRLIKAGGYFLLVDPVASSVTEKHFFNFGEVEGLLDLYEDLIFIENRGITGDGKHFYYVCKKKLEEVEADDDGIC